MDLGSRHGESDTARRVEALKPLLRKVLAALGENPDRDGLRKTPERWAKALLEYTRGEQQEAQEHLKVVFELDEDDYPLGSDDMVIVDSIEFASTCEHHLAPFRGRIHLAYIPDPDSRVITGLSKLSRVVEVFAARPPGPGAHDTADSPGDRREPEPPGGHSRNPGRSLLHDPARCEAGRIDHHHHRTPRSVPGKARA